MQFGNLLVNLPIGWQWYFTALVFLGGLCWGSFLNVCIYRIPLHLSIVLPPSHCPRCQRYIAWYDNIPLLSYLILRARCRHCNAAISPRYFFIELLTGFLFVLVWLKFVRLPGADGLGFAELNTIRIVPVYWLALAGLIVGTFVDFEHMIIPDRVTWGGIATGVVLSTLVPEMHFQDMPAGSVPWHAGTIEALKGAGVGFGLLWGVAFIGKMIFKRDAMGFGDVKLLGAIGAFLGWKAVIFTIIVSSAAGAIVGLTLVALKHKRLQSKIPYGPYLALAALLWMLWGPMWWQAYIRLFIFETP